MRRMLLVTAVVVALAVPALADAATKTVTIRAGGFNPTAVTIKTGDRITWRNNDTRRHQVVADSGGFASPILGRGRAYSFTFNRTGTFRYHDGLFPARKGRVVVQARPIPPGVTLTRSADTIVFGDPIRLSGAVSSGKPNEIVTVFARRSGELSFVQVATVLTGASGFWSFDARPGILTAYQARYRDVVSGEVLVQVRPRVRLLGSRTHLLARVIAARSFAGHWVVLQRRTLKGTWVGVRRLQLGRNSGKLVRIPRRRGRSIYRAYLTQKQAGDGYVASWSGTQPVLRRR
jgi:plastocyanin